MFTLDSHICCFSSVFSVRVCVSLCAQHYILYPQRKPSGGVDFPLSDTSAPLLLGSHALDGSGNGARAGGDWWIEGAGSAGAAGEGWWIEQGGNGAQREE